MTFRITIIMIVLRGFIDTAFKNSVLILHKHFFFIIKEKFTLNHSPSLLLRVRFSYEKEN